MTQYLKENGFPVDLEFTTPQKYEDKENSFYGFKCDVLVDGHHYDELYFTDIGQEPFMLTVFLPLTIGNLKENTNGEEKRKLIEKMEI